MLQSLLRVQSEIIYYCSAEVLSYEVLIFFRSTTVVYSTQLNSTQKVIVKHHQAPFGPFVRPTV